jgi:CRP-like cAMP-binding protein
MDLDAARELLEANSVLAVEMLGPRLAQSDEQHYRALFQTADSRIAALLLEIAGGGAIVEGLTQGEIGETLGMYRETVANTLNAMKMDRLIEVGRMKITLLDKHALRELSEL